ncbi:hypothetical protein QW71_29465 [Paenibacillus sp. IHB B 3415]|uniref:hypothetical protein n=1 Tax=Paenibacillus sp. IHB B 3415 TaxID=867080 RepID=UPI000573E94E|nr:hypothetical protein [Paenibacillus sp. IHB B 3415]KHL92376.1 hypothetical protein QW71_29465 [Paenibacillus sp. IHB B 3415]
MFGDYRDFFTITSDGINQLFYEDSSCRVFINVADFRDEIWWTTIIKAVNKKSDEVEKINNQQKIEIYRRICAHKKLHSTFGIMTSEFKLVEAEMSSIDSGTKILDITGE